MVSSKHLAAAELWSRLLSDERVGAPARSESQDPNRNELERDFDRLVFSSAFRRMQDKTQVFPLSKNDFTRSRLTHSIEVSCVGRSLGRGLSMLLKSAEFSEVACIDIGGIVAAACLAHDIGNPPFGHSDEVAIQSWAQRNTRNPTSCLFWPTTSATAIKPLVRMGFKLAAGVLPRVTPPRHGEFRTSGGGNSPGRMRRRALIALANTVRGPGCRC